MKKTNAIKRLREEAGFTPSQISRRVGATRQAINLWENGGLPSARFYGKLVKLADSRGVTLLAADFVARR